MVVVSDGILNSNIVAERRIICQGKRAAVIGGILQAAEEICAKSLGSSSGNTETVCEVGFDPNKKARLDELTEKRDSFAADFETININLQTLTNTKRQRGSLSDEKEKFLTELTENHKKISDELVKLDDEIAEINQFLREIKASGRVSASGQFYPGVVIKIRNIKYVVTTDYKASTFVLEDNIIRAVSYIEPAVNISQKTVK
jgi:uncharacterized protein (DUF342 family)